MFGVKAVSHIQESRYELMNRPLRYGHIVTMRTRLASFREAETIDAKFQARTSSLLRVLLCHAFHMQTTEALQLLQIAGRTLKVSPVHSC